MLDFFTIDFFKRNHLSCFVAGQYVKHLPNLMFDTNILPFVELFDVYTRLCNVRFAGQTFEEVDLIVLLGWKETFFVLYNGKKDAILQPHPLTSILSKWESDQRLHHVEHGTSFVFDWMLYLKSHYWAG